jgi:hypothetical protein
MKDSSLPLDPVESSATPSKTFVKDKKSLGRVITDKRNLALKDNLTISN